jgi:iron complex outermembrane receptor protein
MKAKSRHIRLGISSVASAAALLVSSAAFAEAGVSPPAHEASADQNGDIVVTAQRRNESLQKVPIAVTAITPAAIQNLNIRTIDNIQTVTPGLVFNTGYAFPQTYIRGVGTLAALGGLEQPVSLYIDGVYVPRSVGTVFDLIDIGSVEVLKGPQGTLYGRNATGGAILINRANPTHEFGATGELEYGRFNHIKADAAINLPVNDQFAVRLVAGYVKDDGFIRNVFTDKRNDGRRAVTLRGKALWEPTTNFSALLSVEYDHTNLLTPAPGKQLSTGALCVPCGLGVTTPAGFYQVNNDFDGNRPGYALDTTLRLQYEAGPLSFQSISAYRKVTFDRASDRGGTDSDTSPIPLLRSFGYFKGETYSEDFQVSSRFEGIVNFLAGGQVVSDRGLVDFGLSGLALGLPYSSTAASIANTTQHIRTNSYAAFAEVYIKPIHRLTITLGGRYSRDTRRMASIVSPEGVAVLDPGGPAAFAQRVSSNKFTPRAVIAYDTGPVNLYASYTRGFKAGGFNTPSFGPQPVPIRPENITSYEIGAKFASADRRTHLNVAAFRYIYKDLQVSSVDILSGGQFITNASSAHGKGIEAEFNQEVGKWLTFSAGAAYLDAHYVSYPNASIFVPTAGGYANGVADLSGVRLPRAPKWTAFVSPSIHVPVGDDYLLRLSPVLRYTSSYDFEPDGGGPDHNDRQKRLTLVNLSGGIGPRSGRYEIGFYVDNLTNRKYYSLIVTGNFGAAGYAVRPRAFGARVKFKI